MCESLHVAVKMYINYSFFTFIMYNDALAVRVHTLKMQHCRCCLCASKMLSCYMMHVCRVSVFALIECQRQQQLRCVVAAYTCVERGRARQRTCLSASRTITTVPTRGCLYMCKIMCARTNDHVSISISCIILSVSHAMSRLASLLTKVMDTRCSVVASMAEHATDLLHNSLGTANLGGLLIL